LLRIHWQHQTESCSHKADVKLKLEYLAVYGRASMGGLCTDCINGTISESRESLSQSQAE